MVISERLRELSKEAGQALTALSSQRSWSQIMGEEQLQKKKKKHQKHSSFPSGAFGFNFIRGQEPATIKYPLRSFYCSNWLINISVFPPLYLREFISVNRSSFQTKHILSDYNLALYFLFIYLFLALYIYILSLKKGIACWLVIPLFLYFFWKETKLALALFCPSWTPGLCAPNGTVDLSFPVS